MANVSLLFCVGSPLKFEQTYIFLVVFTTLIDKPPLFLCHSRKGNVSGFSSSEDPVAVTKLSAGATSDRNLLLSEMLRPMKLLPLRRSPEQLSADLQVNQLP